MVTTGRNFWTNVGNAATATDFAAKHSTDLAIYEAQASGHSPNTAIEELNETANRIDIEGWGKEAARTEAKSISMPVVPSTEVGKALEARRFANVFSTDLEIPARSNAATVKAEADDIGLRFAIREEIDQNPLKLDGGKVVPADARIFLFNVLEKNRPTTKLEVKVIESELTGQINLDSQDEIGHHNRAAFGLYL